MSVASPVVQTWDGANRRIYLAQGVSSYAPIEDIYREYRNQRRLDENLRKFEPLLVAEGNVAKGGGKFTPRYVKLLNGTKIVPYDEALRLDLVGEIITDNPDVDPEIYDITGLTTAKPLFILPSEAEVITVQTGSGVTPQDILDIAAQVWNTLKSSHTTAGTFGKELTDKPNTGDVSTLKFTDLIKAKEL